MNDTDNILAVLWSSVESDVVAVDRPTPSFSKRTEQMREMLHELKERGDENAAMILRLQGVAEKIVATLDAIGVTLEHVQTQVAVTNTRLYRR